MSSDDEVRSIGDDEPLINLLPERAHRREQREETNGMMETIQALLRQNTAMLEMLQQNNTAQQQRTEVLPETRSFSIMPDFSKTIEDFTGEKGPGNAQQWVNQIVSTATLHSWPDQFVYETAKSHLKGAAKSWYQGRVRELPDWVSFRAAFEKTFLMRQSRTQLWVMMKERAQKNGENTSQYFHEKVALCKQLQLPFNEIKEQIAIGLWSREATNFMISKYHVDEDDLYQDLLQFERIEESRRSRIKTSGANIKKDNFVKPKVHVKSENERQFAKDKNNKLMCYACKGYGHYARDCPARKTTGYPSDTKDVVKSTSVNHVDANSEDPNLKYFKDAFLNGHRLESYVDFGSQVCVLQDKYVVKLGLMCDPSERQQVIGYGGAKFETLGAISCNLVVDGVKADVKVHVVPSERQHIPLIVGHPFTEQSHIKVVKTAKNLEFSELPLNERHDEAKTVLWAKGTSVIPNNVLGCIVVKSDLKDSEICIEGHTRDNGEIIPRCVLKTDEQGEAVVPVLNISGQQLRVIKDQNIARGEKCKEGDYRREINTEPIHDEEVNTELSGVDKTQLVDLLNEYKDLVARNMRQLGRTDLVSMSIELNDEQPVYYRPYRMAYSERQKLREIVEELKEADIVEESTSPFASPVLLVKKKNGDVRLCVDYRALNKRTIKEHYPLPLIDDQLDRLRGQVYYTTLDLSGAYYQIPMSEKSKEKTAFVTPDGLYNFKRMSFGLANAPSCFQRLINIVLGSLRYDVAMAYLDDVIIPSETIEEGLNKIREVFDRFRHAKLTLNLKKCFFFMTKIEYLGFTVSKEGIAPGERKLKAVADFPVPADLSKVRSFMGLASYFRRFVKNFAVITRPITDLLRKDAAFVWGDSQQRAFDEVKCRLMTRPVLCVYDPKARTELHTDACSYGIGAVILQEQPIGKLQPIAYFSRKTSREESKYSSFELEGLAIIAALERFRVYLLGMHFIIRTDCNSLKLLANKRDLNPRIGRWFVKLSEFDYTIEYHKGVENKVADALSRNPVEESNDVEVSGLPIFAIKISTDWVAALQRTCNEVQSIVSKLEQGDKVTHERFTLYKGRVYRTKGVIWRLYVPTDLRYDLVSDAHRELMHLGIDKTLARMKENYYFPKMRDFVTRYVNRCINCLYYKTPRGKQPGFLHPLEKGKTPFQIVHMDHLGPFVTTERENKYVVALIDGYSKYSVLKAVPNVGAEETVLFLREFITNYGKPERIITDRGTAYVSNLFEDFCKVHNMQHSRISTGVPRANGQVERLNSMIITSAATGTSDVEGSDWDLRVSDIQWAVNKSVHTVTKRTPFSLIFKYKRDGFSSNPLAREIDEVNDEVGNSSVDEPINDLLERNRQNMAKQFNKSRKPGYEYQPGDIVMIRAEAPATGQSRKLEPKYKGPYEVVKLIGNDRYLIQDIEGEQQSCRFYKGIISVDRLKLVRKCSKH